MLLYNEVKYTEVCSIGRNMSEGLKFGMVDGRSLQCQRFVTIRRCKFFLLCFCFFHRIQYFSRENRAAGDGRTVYTTIATMLQCVK